MLELKNAEIDVLRKQLNRAEHTRIKVRVEQKKITKMKAEREKETNIWSKEREGLQEEIRRLNVEISSLKGRYQHRKTVKEDKEEEIDMTT